MSTSRKFILKSSDGQTFEVEEAVARESITIGHLIEAVTGGDPDSESVAVIPLPNVTGKIMSKVIEFCKRHVEGGKMEDLNDFDADFVEVDQGTLFEIILAANYLEVKKLLELTCQTVADIINGKTVEEIRKQFNIVNDFSDGEDEEIRREYPWAFYDGQDGENPLENPWAFSDE